MQSFIASQNGSKLRILDIGDKNYISENLTIPNTWVFQTDKSDFNESVKAVFAQFDFVTCFEVLEHVMNAAVFINEIKRFAPTIFLSTPKLGVIPLFFFDEHFTEYKVPQLRTLFSYCDLEIIREKVFCPYPWWFAFTGIRPLLRVLLQRCVVFELQRSQ
jgi:2-polyprenyl-3-methyl-5-hydroxy-6-metoxy-1,4-benzoquinol methylase